MPISIVVSAWTVSIFAPMLVSYGRSVFVPMLVSYGRSVFVPMLVGALLSMFVLAVLRLKAERSHAAHRKRTEGQYDGFQGILHEGKSLLVRRSRFRCVMLRHPSACAYLWQA
jgi:hypothetical protein